MQALSAETVALFKEATSKSKNDLIAKSTNYTGFLQPGSATSGLNAYDLSKPAQKIYPVITPLRNMVPRTGGAVGTASNWRTITGVTGVAGVGISFMGMGVSDRQRSGVITTAVQDNTAPYKGMGNENFVSYEADWAGQTFEDVKNDAILGSLHSLMMYEEVCMLGGHGTSASALGTTPTPTVADLTTGGFLAPNTAYNVICVALTLEGYIAATQPTLPSPFTTSPFAGGGSILGQVSRTNANASTTTFGGGSALQSADGTVTTANDSNSTHALSVSVAAVNGAVAYAWFAGTTSGTERLYTITTINSVRIYALNSSGQLASAIPNAGADNSVNALIYDGLLAQVSNSGSNSIKVSLATGTTGTGTPLSNDGANGITQINSVLKQMWDTFRLGPTKMFVSSQELTNITSKILQSGSTGAFRMVSMGTDDKGNLVGGGVIAQYLNPYNLAGNKMVDIVLHPNMPAGTILFYCDNIPYQIETNVKNPVDMYMRRDYYQIEWPQTLRSYDYGIYCDGVMRNFFTPSFALLTNIGNG